MAACRITIACTEQFYSRQEDSQLLGGCESQFLAMLAHSSEFENVAVREEELPELDELCLHQCPFDVKGGPENKHGKVNILLQVMPYPTSLLIFH